MAARSGRGSQTPPVAVPDDDRVGDAGGALRLDVAQGAERPGGQPHDGDEIEQSHEAQGDVREGPDDGQGEDGSGEGRCGEQDAEDLLGAELPAQDVHVDLRVRVAAEHGG